MPALRSPSSWPPTERTSKILALAVWGVLTFATCWNAVDKILYWPNETLANITEEHASEQWWSQGSLYRPIDSPYFLYLPHAAILYTPFHAGPEIVRHLAVRLLYVAFLLFALALFAGLGDPRRRWLRFLLLSVVCVPVTGDSIRAGQANLPLTACMLLAAVAIARAHWNRATLALLAGLAFKPLGIVFVLLAGGMWLRSLGWRLALGLVVFAAFPFAFGPPAYVAGEYRDFFLAMGAESDPTRYFSDIRGLLVKGVGLDVSYEMFLVIRAGAALGTLGLALVARRRWERTDAALAFYVLAATYLMLFNPKTEGPTFAILGPAAGVLLAWAVLCRRSVWLSLLVLASTYGIALNWEIMGRKNYWGQPMWTVLFFALVIGTILIGTGRKRCPWICPA